MQLRSSNKKATPSSNSQSGKASSSKQKKGNQRPPDLETFLTELNDWPDVTYILLGNAFKQTTEAFTEVADFRAEFKHTLKSCFGEGRKKAN